jgi:hypothetical protein
MEKSGKRGKIPQADWPLIMARYEQGETLSSIARTYDCSPPAISYIVSRSREKPASEAGPAPLLETQLVKASSGGGGSNGSAAVESSEIIVPAAKDATESRDEATAQTAHSVPTRAGAEAPSNGESFNAGRRTLHLSLGNGNGNGNGHHAVAPSNGHEEEVAPARPIAVPPRSPQMPRAFNGHNGRATKPAEPSSRGRNLFDEVIAEGKPVPQQPRDIDGPRKDNGSFIDQELRTRVDGDIAAFLAAFDAALAADTQESRFGLREATDRLLRAGARTRIELERLEARVPLTPREGRGGAEPAWRYR